MKTFRNWTLAWWEIGILEASLIALGIALGVYFVNFLKEGLIAFVVIAIVGLLYFIVFRIKEVSIEQ